MEDISSSGALSGYDDPYDPNKKQLDQQPGAAQTPGQALNVGGATSDVLGGGSASAPAGAGGGGGWTNIQSYLGANQGDTGTSDYINKQVGDQFSKEQSDLDSAGAGVVQSGVDQANKIKNDTAGSGGMLDAASSAYQWGDTQNDPYNQSVSTLKGDLNGVYTGPTSFSYGMSQPTQQYGSNLSNDKDFGQMLNQSYAQRSGQSMNDGQLALQRQLDTTNDPLQQTRQNLLGQYSGLQTKINDTVSKNNDALTHASEDYRTNQNALRGFLSGQSGDISTKIAQEQAAKHDEYGGLKAQEADQQGLYNNAVNARQSRIDEIRRDFGAGSLPHYGNEIAGYDRDIAAKQAALTGLTTRNNDYASAAQNQSQGDKARFNTISSILGTGTPLGQYYDVGNNNNYAGGTGLKRTTR